MSDERIPAVVNIERVAESVVRVTVTSTDGGTTLIDETVTIQVGDSIRLGNLVARAVQ